MGFTAIYFQNIPSFRYFRFPQTYAQFINCYPQPIVTKEKRAGKLGMYFLCSLFIILHLFLAIFSYPHHFVLELSANVNVF